MKKKYIFIIIPIIILALLLITKYNNKNIEKFYLTDKYYQNNQFIKVESKDINKLNKEKYILFTYNNFCTLPISCEYIFEEFMKNNNISFISIPFEEFKKTTYYRKVKYAPSILIIKEGKIIAYLDANSDEDLNKYQDVDEFKNWLNNYIYLKKE